MANTQDWQFETCQTTQELKVRIKYTKNFRFRYVAVMCMYNYWGDRTDLGLYEPLWSICMNCQFMTELEMIHILQALVCGCIRTHPGLPHKKQNGKQVMHQKRQLNQTGWKRTVLNFGSKHQLNVHNYLSIIFYFNLIARYGKNYVTITLTGFASHT